MKEREREGGERERERVSQWVRERGRERGREREAQKRKFLTIPVDQNAHSTHRKHFKVCGLALVNGVSLTRRMQKTCTSITYFWPFVSAEASCLRYNHRHSRHQSLSSPALQEDDTKIKQAAAFTMKTKYMCKWKIMHVTKTNRFLTRPSRQKAGKGQIKNCRCTGTRHETLPTPLSEPISWSPSDTLPFSLDLSF